MEHIRTIISRVDTPGTIKRQDEGPARGNPVARQAASPPADTAKRPRPAASLSTPRPVASPYPQLDPYAAARDAGWVEVAMVRLPVSSGTLGSIFKLLQEDFPQRLISVREGTEEADTLTFGWWERREGE